MSGDDAKIERPEEEDQFPMEDAGEPGSAGSIAAPPAADDFSRPHPLENSWTLWYNGAAKKGKDGTIDWSVKKIIDFDSVEDFWRLYNNIAKPSELGTGSNYHLFKTGTAPEWEDPVNKAGGKWVLNLPRKRAPPGQPETVDEAWQWTLLALIGEFFEEHSDEICGVVISPRKGTNRLALWTKTASREQVCVAIGQSFRDTLRSHLRAAGCEINDLNIEYAVHADCLKHKTSFRTSSRYKID
jgi:translation initiation factor 4E